MLASRRLQRASAAPLARRSATPLGFMHFAGRGWSQIVTTVRARLGTRIWAIGPGGRRILVPYSGQKHRVRAPVTAIWLSCMVVLGLSSCSGDRGTCPEPCRLPSGRAVVDCSFRVDEHGHFYTEVFSFAAGGAVRFPNAQGIEPDLIVTFMTGSDGEFQGFLLGQMDLAPALCHIATGETLEDGQVLFAGATCVPEDANFQGAAGPARPYQVWGVRSRTGEFGKILIVDSFFCAQEYDSAGATVSRWYGEITFDWQYQPDGTRCFE